MCSFSNTQQDHVVDKNLQSLLNHIFQMELMYKLDILSFQLYSSMSSSLGFCFKRKALISHMLLFQRSCSVYLYSALICASLPSLTLPLFFPSCFSCCLNSRCGLKAGFVTGIVRASCLPSNIISFSELQQCLIALGSGDTHLVHLSPHMSQSLEN